MPGYTYSQVSSFLLSDLKSVCQSLQLNPSGSKAELRHRLLSYLEHHKLLLAEPEPQGSEVEEPKDGAASHVPSSQGTPKQKVDIVQSEDVDEEQQEELESTPMKDGSLNFRETGATPRPQQASLPSGGDPNLLAMMQLLQASQNTFMLQMMENQQSQLMTMFSDLQKNAGLNASMQSVGTDETAIRSRLDWIFAHSIASRMEKIEKFMNQDLSSTIVKSQVTALREGLGKLEDFLSEKLHFMHEKSIPEIEAWFQKVCADVMDLECSAMRYVDDKDKKKKEEEDLKKAGSLPHNVEIPKLFNPDEFPFYWEIYDNLVYSNPKVSPYWKMNYLRQGMKGGTKHIFDSITPLVENLQSHIDLLFSRYGQPRKIVRHAVKNIVDSKPANGEPSSLRENYDNLLARYRCIDKYHEKLEKPLDAVLLPIFESKLPKKLKEDWERKLIDDSTEFPSADSFFEWYSTEVQAKEIIEESSKSEAKKTEEKFSRTEKYKPESKYHTAQVLVSKDSIYEKSASNSEESRSRPRNKKESSLPNEPREVYSCLYCEGKNHVLTICYKFKKLSAFERHDFARKNYLCFSCLVSLRDKTHGTQKCHEKCTICQKYHHELLHLPPRKDESEPKEIGAAPIAAVSQEEKQAVDTIFPTAKALLSNGVNEPKEVRIAFDTMCQRTFITNEVVSTMKLENSSPITLEVKGFGNKSTTLETKVASFSLAPLLNPDRKIEIRATIKTEQICAKLPPMTLDFEKCSHLKNLHLSDEYPREKEETVDLLIGLDYLFQFFGNDIIRHNNANLPVAIQSIFGYVVLGPNIIAGCRKRSKKKEVCNVMKIDNFSSYTDPESDASLDAQLERFWKIESIGLVDRNQVMTADEKSATTQFEDSLKYEDERYEVTLPAKPNAPILTSNYKQVEKEMFSMEKRLLEKEDPQKRQDYDSSIMAYEKLGFAREATPEEAKEFDDSGSEYFVPHQAVIRKGHVSTEMRSVFNASSRDPNGNSLNDCLLPGPALQPDIGKLMLRFRVHLIALMGDIRKMFCQTKVSPECYKFQQFLWRSYNLSSKPRRYIMTRLMFGITSSPFLAMATVRHHLSRPDMQELYENACKLALENIYVDDVCIGGNSDSEVIQLAKDLVEVFKKGGWKLTKFVSNSKKVMATIPEEDRLPSLVVDFEENEYGMTKALGVGWNVEKDVFTFSLTDSLTAVKKVETKRSIVSRVSAIFDVFGFYAAFTIRAKIFIQKLWTLKVGWDDPLEEETVKEYRQWCEELKSLPSIEIPRCVIPPNPKTIELHGFGDASQVAYGASIYIRTETENGEICTNLLMAKTRVAPLKTKSMPRLELLAAFTCAKLMDYVHHALDLAITEVRYWSDSEIVLAWLDKPSTRWKTFVANRVQEIHDISDPKSWAKVSGEENPADYLSRGLSVDELATNDLYWHGPTWLSKPKSEWNHLDFEISENLDLSQEEAKISALPTSTTEDPFPLITRVRVGCGKYMKVIRVVARMYRWLFSARKRLKMKNKSKDSNPKDQTKERSKNEELSAEEIQLAEYSILRAIQLKHFDEEYADLMNGRKISKSSKILNLDPKFDETKRLIVVGGRLKFANLPEEAKCQIILPSNLTEPLVSKIIQHIHVENCHSPMNVTFSISRSRFWIIHGRRSVGRTVRSCLICMRSRTRPMEQKMGDLPPERVNISVSFMDIGLDFAGPLYIKVGNDLVKSYIAVFSCAASRLLHLELTMDMTAEEFILALRRALNRRGKCKTINSDNQSSYKRADKLLRLSFSDRLLKKLKTAEVERYLAEKSIQWTFITEKSPFRGGYWERLVRSVKEPLRKVLGRSLLKYTEAYTLLTDIEAMINQRPLTPISNDSRDDEILTPAHLALGRPLGDLPDIPKSDDAPISKRYRFLQILRNRLWLRWSKEYLHSLQSRYKWKVTKPEIRIGDVVLVSDENSKRNVWPLARVVNVVPSKDGIIRTARVKTAKGFLNRPIQRLHLLEGVNRDAEPLENESDSEQTDPIEAPIPTVVVEKETIPAKKTRSGRSIVKPKRLGIEG